MRQQILAGAMALALATGMTSSAMAFGHGGHVGGHAGSFGGHVGMGAIHSGFAANRMAGVRGYSAMRHGGWGGPGYDAYGPTYYGYGTPIDAWSR